MDPREEKIYNAAEFVKSLLGGRTPQIGIVLGSGLGKLADKIINPVTIPYKTIPGFLFPQQSGTKGISLPENLEASSLLRCKEEYITMRAILWRWSHCQ